MKDAQYPCIQRVKIKFLNPFMPNVFSNPYQLDNSISNSRVVRWCFSVSFKILKKLLQANRREPDQTPLFVASDLVLYCLPMSHKKDARLISVKNASLVISITSYGYISMQ